MTVKRLSSAFVAMLFCSCLGAKSYAEMASVDGIDDARKAFMKYYGEQKTSDPKMPGFEISNEIPKNWISDTIIPYIGPEMKKVTLVVNGVEVEKFWAELSPEVWRSQLQGQFSKTVINRVEADGSLTLVPVGVSLEKKSYRLIYNNFITKDYPCSPKDPEAGSLLVGVGLRITADINTKSGGLKVPLISLAANAKKVKGSIEGRIVGLATSQTLSQVVGAGSKVVTFESLVEATNAYAVANAVLENKNLVAVPQVVGFVDRRAPNSCFDAMNGK